MYIDEVGNHDLGHVEDPNQRFLSLTGVILEGEYTRTVIQPEMEALKRTFFREDPDEPIILHRKEIVNRRRAFQVLREPEMERQFNAAVLAALNRWDLRVVTIVIDKKAHREQYRVWRYQPYHYCLAVLLERYVLFLQRQGHMGDVMVESRGGAEDRRLADSYQRLFEWGTDYVPQSEWQQSLSSSQLKVKPKSMNIAGLQIADLVAHQSRREVLRENGLIVNDREIFGDQICDILRQAKYLRDSHSGQIGGYGKKLLP